MQEGSEGCSEKSLKHKGRRTFRCRDSSVADPDPGYGPFLTPRFGIPDPTIIFESVGLKLL